MNRDASGLVRWRIRTCEAWQAAAAGSAFWFDNRNRPGGAVIFQYTREGALTVRQGGRRQRIGPGCAALMRFGDACDYGLDPGDGEAYACTYLTFQGAGLMAHWAELIGLHGVCVPYGEDVLGAALELCASAQGCPPALLATRVHAFVMLLYERPASAAGGERPAIDRAIAAIRAEPCAVTSLKQLAAAYGLSREHLARVFRERTGEAPWAIITRARLSRAKTLLADPALSVAEVAKLCGYASARVLARNLVESTGRSPAYWRR